jgi:hypothetical protein
MMGKIYAGATSQIITFWNQTALEMNPQDEKLSEAYLRDNVSGVKFLGGEIVLASVSDDLGYEQRGIGHLEGNLETLLIVSVKNLGVDQKQGGDRRARLPSQ